MESKSCTVKPICCMCGDHGLSRELFRCKLCLFRSQHKYCSNLYPKAVFYRACNWCLKEEAGNKVIMAEQSTVDRICSESSTSLMEVNCSNAGSGLKLARRAFLPHILNKSVKKQRLDSVGGGDEISPESGRGKQVFRGKVRRYKLLDDVPN